MENETSPKKLLWTGGWDSTYRLCELAIVLRQPVQPYYLIDEGRKSLREELEAQANIKAAIIKKFPYTEALIMPTQYFPVSDLKKNRTIEKHYLNVKKEVGFGSQYEWLANFCHSNSINDLELGFEKDPVSSKNIFISRFIIKKSNTQTYILSKVFKSEPGYEIFKYFEWPLWDTTRDDMLLNSKKYDFDDIMHLTWFCHNPVNGKTCGLCNPCKDAVIYGFAYRLTKSALLKYKFRVLHPVTLKKRLRNTITKTAVFN